MIPIKLPKEHKELLVERVRAYFEEEGMEPVGNLAAERLVDFMIGELGPHVYNKAIGDVRLMMSRKAEQLEDELYAMEQPLRPSR